MPAATTTEVEVCNLALQYVGNGQAINSLEERTQESKSCKIHYAKARDAFLEAFPWKFATKRVVLAEVAGQARDGWKYVYALPADSLAPRRIWNGARLPSAGNKIPFDIEGIYLLTDKPQAQLIYTFQETVVARWTPTAIDALAWELAMRLSIVIPVRKDWARDAEAKAARAYRLAAGVNLRGSQEDPEPPSEFTSIR